MTNPNYEDFVHAAKLTITNRPVTVTSADGSWTYDGQPHSSATVSTEGFVDGEGVVASNFATITGVGSAANAFDYTFADGTLAENYAVTCVTGTLTVVAATIHYVADNVTGEYNGAGYGIDVSVSAPASGAVVKYAESAEGPWLDSLAYVDVCEDRPIYFQITATGYTTAVDSRTVTVTPKTLTEDYVWLVLPWEDYVYDGTAKEPEFTCGDGDPSIITLDDFDVSYLDNIDAGTATAVFTGKGNYTGTVTEEFDIWPREVTFTSGSASKVYDGTALVKHEVAVSGDGFIDGEGASYEYTGSQMGVGASENTFTYTLNDGTKAGNYDISTINGTLTVTPATIHYVADNVTGEYNGTGYGIDVSVSAPVSGAAVKFAESAEGPWLDSLSYVDVCEDRPIYFQITATGYTTAVDSRTVTVTPKTLTEDYVWLVLPWEDYVYDGTAKEPEFTCGDGEPSIITLDDFDVSYLDNIDAGTATAVFTGKGNYTGTVTEEFDIWPREVTFTSGSATKVYDGTALVKHDVTVSGDGFIDGEGVTFDVIGSQTNVGASENAFTYTLNEGTKASNYDISTVNGTLTVTKASAGGEGGEEPGDGEVPTGGESKFDVTAMYDGEGHTIDTNALAVAFSDAVIGEIAVEYAEDDGSGNVGLGAPALPWGTVPAYTNAGEYVVWYRVSNPNYEDFIHAAKVTITNRPVTVTSADGSWTYDGQAHSNAKVTTEGFVDGEGVVANNFATITDVGSTVNSFDYVFDDGTLATNYAVTCVTGTLSVVAAGMDGWTDDAKWSVTLSGDGEKYDGTEKTCEVTALAYDGFAIPTFTVTGNTATDAGDYTLNVTGTGNFSGSHTFPWSIVKREVTLTSGSDSKVYDGIALTNHTVAVSGDGFVTGEGASYEYTGSQTDVGTSANAFTYTLNDGTKAGNYEIATVNGTLMVTKASVGPGGGDEPGGGEVPEGGESKFDVAAMYDGEGHTIDTNALTAAFGEAMIGESVVEYAVDDGSAGIGGPGAPALPWGAVPVYTNVGEYVVWYRVSNPNYNDFIHAAKVTITNRPVTVTSADGSWTYDGQAHSNATVTTEGFVDGEGVVANNFATITDVGSVANAFDYAFADGTLAENYAVTCVTGTLTVVAAGMDGWTDEAKWAVTLSGDGAKYDGTEKTCEVTALAYDGFAIPTFTVAGNTATDAGDYTLTVTGTGNFSGSHTFPWSITRRAVTLTSGDASKVYDGIALTNHTVSVSDDGFAAGEGASCEYTGSQTAVGTSENTFTYTLNDGTKAGNYDISTVNGTLTVTPATLNPTDVFGGDASETPLVCEKTFNGAAQPVEILPNFDEPYQFLWALAEGNENAYSATAPTLRNVADGELTVFFKFVTANYEPYYGKVVFRILAKELTDEMVVLSDEAFYYDPGSTVKKPSVTVADTNALGEVISTANDYTVAYENATAAGAIPVTVTAKNNYTGTVTKTFPVLKRPVAPPVIGTKAYNGRTQKATVTTDSRWTVVRNNGGVDVGEYEVVLRLTNTEDYRWKGVGEDEAEWTGVFRITKANNGWSRYPGMTGWTYGETPNEPVMGQARYGTVQVAYRRKGTDVSTETATKPSAPGTYIARFWVDETENHIGVALSTPYEVEFEIAPGAGGFTETQTTPVPVPYVWLDPYLAKYGEGDYEAAGHATGANGYALWESYVAGLDPEDPTSKLRAFIEMLSDNTPKVTWSPDLSNAEVPRTYTTLGKAKLTDADWTPVTGANKSQMHFFKVTVEMEVE